MEKTDPGLALEVANTGAWAASPAPGVVSTGIGLDNLRQRLHRYYPSTHRFATTVEDGWVIARVELGSRALQPAALEHA